jgi:hypothetical protein
VTATRVRLLAVVAVVVLLVVGVAAVVLGAGGTAKPTDRTAIGIVTHVDAASLTDVRGFDLRTDGGTTLHFELGRLDMSPPAFNPQHLSTHAATAEPVKVTYQEDGGRLVAVRLEDGD